MARLAALVLLALAASGCATAARQLEHAPAAIASASATGAATGAGVTVYVFDGGVSTTHPELAGRVRRGFTAFPGDAPICNAHGTAVAGAIGGASRGVAPAVDIVDVKVIDCWRQRGSVEAIVAAARWVLEDARRHPRRRAIANWSFLVHASGTIPALDSAIAALTRAGIPVVVAAGNREQDACGIAPANVPDAITVGATDAVAGRVPRRLPGTAHGPCVDVYARGDSAAVASLGDDGAPTTAPWGGTSIAAGFVSGRAALYLEQHPQATVRAIEAHLRGGGNAPTYAAHERDAR